MSSRNTTDGTVRIVLIVLAVLVLGPILMMFFMFPLMGMWGGMMGGFGGSGIAPVWGLGMMVLWLAILIGGGYLVYRWLTRSEFASTDPAMEELRLAYARGDISEDEFDERRSKLYKD